jgi:hypothetical protein
MSLKCGSCLQRLQTYGTLNFALAGKLQQAKWLTGDI